MRERARLKREGIVRRQEEQEAMHERALIYRAAIHAQGAAITHELDWTTLEAREYAAAESERQKARARLVAQEQRAELMRMREETHAMISHALTAEVEAARGAAAQQVEAAKRQRERLRLLNVRELERLKMTGAATDHVLDARVEDMRRRERAAKEAEAAARIRAIEEQTALIHHIKTTAGSATQHSLDVETNSWREQARLKKEQEAAAIRAQLREHRYAMRAIVSRAPYRVDHIL